MAERSAQDSSKVMSENEQVELIFLKFGLARSDEQLEAIVDKYLPVILEKVESKDGGVHSKVMELLNHISNRLKNRISVKLPVSNLLKLYISDSSGFVANFVIIYIKLGFRRLSQVEKNDLAPTLFASIEGKPRAHQDALMRLLISTFPFIKLPELPGAKKDLFQFDKFTSATKRLLEFCLDVLLLQYSANFTSQNSTPSRPATAPVGGTSEPLQPGLSVNAIKRLIDPSDISWDAQQIEQLKIGILNLIGGDFFPENDIICHLVVASSDTRHTVSTAADLEIRKRQGATDWDNVGLISQLYRLYLGDSQVQQASKKMKKASPESLRQPASLRTKLKIVQSLLRSRLATERFPSTIQLVYDALFAESSTSKLQILGLEFVHHISDSCGLPKLAAQSPLLLEAMLKIIRNVEKEPRTRGLAYTAIGKLSYRVPNLFSTKLQLLQDCFQALSQENSQELKLYIQEALAMMAKSYGSAAESQLPTIEAVVSQYISDQNHLCRLSAVRYAGTVFPTDHVASRFLLLLAMSDAKADVAAEASRILDGTTFNENDIKQVKKENPHSTKEHVTFRKMLEYSYEKAQKQLKSTRCHVIGTQTISFAPPTFLALIKYLRRCFLCDAGINYSASSGTLADGVMDAQKLAEYLGEQWIHEKDIITQLISKYVQLIMQFLRAVADDNAAYILLEMFAVCPDDFPIKCLLAGPLNSEDCLEEYESLVLSRVAWIRSLSHHVKETIREHISELYVITVKRLSPSDPGKKEIVNGVLRDAKSNRNYEKKHGAILILGYLAGDSFSLYQPFMTNDVKDVMYTLVKNALSKDVAISTASCMALAEIMRKSKLSLPDGNVPSNNGKNHKNVEDISPDGLTKSDIVDILIWHMKSSTIHRLREKSIVALGCLLVGDPDYAHREFLLNALMESFDIKETDIMFTVATALCNAALGPASAIGGNRWRKQSSPTTVQDIMQRQDKVSWLLEKILKEYVYHRIPAARHASCIWLMTIVKTEQLSSHPDVLKQLPHIQSAFMSLLSQDDDLVQDVASKGLGVVYELGSDEQKKELVNGLVSSLMGGQNPQATNKDDLFRSMGSLGKAPDGSKLSTYKELCSLASDLNQPDLVYKFLHLAKHHALWNSKKGAAFGFSNIASLASAQLEPHLPQIVPRLYRYTFDPQAGVRSAMTSIWNALAPDPHKLIDTYIREVTNDLSKNLLSATWRTRQASCYALSDLLRSGRGMQGKDKNIFINALPEFWSSTLKVMDDIKETVRDAATAAANSLKKVTLKLCDRDQGSVGEMAVTNILPVLLKDGLSSKVKEVSGISLKTLVDISKESGKFIHGCIPQMVVALLEALSNFEPPTLNYLAVRGDENAREMLDAARVDAARSSPMVQTIERILKYADSETLQQLVPVLAELKKRSVGIMTKAGCSHIIVLIVSQCGRDLTPYSSVLLNALVSGLTDVSIAIRKCDADAISHVIRVAKDASIAKIIKKFQSWYLEKEDDVHRHASAIAISAIGKNTPDVIRAYASITLPLAFLGMHEVEARKNAGTDTTNKKNSNSPKSLWTEVWDEFTPGTATSIKLYLEELIDFTSSALLSPQWKIKAQAAAAMATIAKQQREGTIVGVQLRKLLEVLIHGLQGRTWDGKEKLLTALCAVTVHCKTGITDEDMSTILSLFFKECRTDKLLYKTEAIACLGSILESYKVDKFAYFWKILQPIIQKKESDSDSENESKNEKEANSKLKLALLETAINSCGISWPNILETQEIHFSEVVKSLSDHISLGTWNIQLAALQAMTKILKAMKETIASDQAAMQVDDEDPFGNGQPDNATKKTAFNVDQIGFLNSLLASLGNAKYTKIREEALNLSELLLHLHQDGAITGVCKGKLFSSLKASLLYDKKSSKKSQVDDLIKMFSSVGKS